MIITLMGCRFVIVCFFLNAVVSLACFGQADTTVRVWGEWKTWGDQGNGTYVNPVLPGDYSDIDCIRVGADYYAVSSTFQYSPGFIILHSKDLVNWRMLGHVVKDISTISPEMNWDRMNRYGRGIWAGAIRYHDNKFWVYFGDPDEGYFMSTAPHAEGPWEPLHQMTTDKGWDDGCPFWDDNGDGYFIGTHFSEGYPIHLFRMSADGKSLVKGSDKIIYQSKGSEANKLYKINGVYYHFFSEVRNGGRAIMMERSRNIWGPYEGPKQLSHVQRKYNEPNQGGIIQTAKGDWYFLTHHGSGDWSGRIMSLLPVHWIDGWPIIGKPGPDTIGNMVWTGKKPVNTGKIITPKTSDDFKAGSLAPQWEWNYQPRPGKWSLHERRGWLRLHAFTPLENNNLLKAGNTLTQRSYRTASNEVIVKMDISGMVNGQRAGLSHFGSPNYSTIGIACEENNRTLEFTLKGLIKKGPVITSNNIWLKSIWGLDGNSKYFYSLDGKTYISFGDPYQLMWGAYRGDRLAIYNYNNRTEAGYVDIDYFHYTYSQ